MIRSMVFMFLCLPMVEEAAIGESLPCVWSGDAVIADLLKPIREKYQVPAIIGAIVTSEGIQSKAVIGYRKKGEDVAASLEDTWHVGSITKAMTATLVARLIDQGHLHWDVSIAQAFPSKRLLLHADFHDVTIIHLLTHHAGLPVNLDLKQYQGENGAIERKRALDLELKESPLSPKGSQYLYSNWGYIVVGAILEAIFEASWEQLMRQHLFNPLGMHSTGFGGLGTPGKLDQPWGHIEDGSPVDENGPQIDNPPIMGPAGCVHCAIDDLAKFVIDHLRGAQGKEALLPKATYTKLHTPPFKYDYALGWNIRERAWGGGKVLHHAGSNTMHYANVWIAPLRDFAVLVCINQGGDQALKASDTAVGALIRHHLK